jgi:hypothetical protein
MEYDLSVATARNPLIAITVFGFIAILATGLRLQSRRIRQLSFATDDYLMIASLVHVVPSAVVYSKQLIMDSSSYSFASASNLFVSTVLLYILVTA